MVIIVVISFIINFAIVGCFSNKELLSNSTIMTENSEIDLYKAAFYLGSKLGDIALKAYGIGLFFSGLANTCSGAACGQYIMTELMDIDFISSTTRALITRLVVLLPSLIIARFMQIKYLN